MPAPRPTPPTRPRSITSLAAGPVFTLAAGLVLASCSFIDPYRRDGMWNPNGANEANLGAMVATPTDLARGQSEPGSSGDLAAAAVKRLRTDRLKTLPAVDTTGGAISGGMNGGGGGGGGAAAGGGGN